MKKEQKHIVPVSLDIVKKLVESIPGYNENAATIEVSPLNPPTIFDKYSAGDSFPLYLQTVGRFIRKKNGTK